MSTNAIRVQVGPANYFSFPGAIDKLSEFYPQAARENALWIYGERALAAAIDYLPAEFNSPQAVRASFSTHCSESTVADLVSAAGSDRQVVIGIGGGAVLDTAKVVARKLGLLELDYCCGSGGNHGGLHGAADSWCLSGGRCGHIG